MDAPTAPRTGTGRRANRPLNPRFVGWVVSVLLLAGCAGGSGTSSPLDRVFSDQELTAMLATVQDDGGTPVSTWDSGDLRIAFKDSTGFPVKPVSEPAECAVFQPEGMLADPATLNMNFAQGTLPPSTSSGTDTIFMLVKSAPNGELVSSDFAYTDGQVSHCATFTLISSGGTVSHDARLITAPAVGDKSYATVVTGGMPPDSVTVAMQVLAGTVSIGLARMVSAADADAAAATLAGLARQFIEKASGGAPPISTPPANAMTPEQLAGLLDGVTGPTGNPIHVNRGSVLWPPPTTTPTSVPDACGYDQVSYYGSQVGAATASGQIQGAQKFDTSLPTSAAPPYPFDLKANLFRDCESVRATPAGAAPRMWDLTTLDVTTNGETAYAVAYRIFNPGGSEEWAVLVGARKGLLCVEAETEAVSEGALAPAAAGLADVINQVLARAGE
jgi:hypothetical protein